MRTRFCFLALAAAADDDGGDEDTPLGLTKLRVLCLQHINARGELLNKGQKASVETVKQNAAIRKDLKDLKEMKEDLERVHEEEEKKALRKAKAVRQHSLRCSHKHFLQRSAAHVVETAGRVAHRNLERKRQ